MSRRHFGTVRRRPSGKWQVVYERQGRQRSGGTFAKKADALAALAAIEVSVRQNSWLDPRNGRETLSQFSEQWLDSRHELAVRTRELYLYLLKKYILPDLGALAIGSITTQELRLWHSRLASRVPSAAAKAYRLVSSMYRTAVLDGRVSRSPCVLVGAGNERAPERPTATIQEVFDLTFAMPVRQRLFVQLAVWCQLRRGEILGLQRGDIDLSAATIQVVRSRVFTADGTSLIKSPKTIAGTRTLSVPSHLKGEVESHLDNYVGEELTDFVFTGDRGSPLSPGVLQKAWSQARETIGRSDLHIHDLRHTGLTIAAATGATTAELMRRAGHSSSEAALRYQHGTMQRDRILARALDQILEAKLGE